MGEKYLVPELGHLRVRDTQMPGIRHHSHAYELFRHRGTHTPGIRHQVLLGSVLSRVVVEAHPDEVAHFGAEVRLGSLNPEPLERLGDERVAPAAADQPVAW